jgi:hypothetical protein
MANSLALTRRELIGAGAAASLLVSTLGWSESLTETVPVPYRAIFDERFAPGREFALESARRGWITRAIRGDVTHVWYHELAVRWRQGPAAIAGATTARSLFVLERLAWDIGMRVTVRDTDTAIPLVRWLINLPKAMR